MDVLLDFVCTSICVYDFLVVIAHVCFCRFVGFVFPPQTHTFTFPSKQQSVLYGLQFPVGRIVMAF